MNNILKAVIFTTALVLILVSVSFAFQPHLDSSASFTELWLLGSGHDSRLYPSNIVSGIDYKVYVDIANRLGRSANYMVKMKLANPSQYSSISSMPAVYSIPCFVPDDQTLELPIFFAFNYKITQEASGIKIESFTVNGTINNLAETGTEYFVPLDRTNGGFFEYLFFELWTYNDSLGDYQYSDVSVYLRLNLIP